MSSVSILNHFLETFCPMNSALVTGEGEVLHLRAENPISYGTFGVAAQTVVKYLPLKIGDIALMNDPYSGGSILNEYTFITKLLEAGPLSIWFVQRHPYGHSIVSSKSVEEEGLRIPPTPICQNNQLNQIILGAMSAHPMCPPDFTAWIEKNCRDLETLVKKFTKIHTKHKISFSKNSIKEYLDTARDVVKEKISESASGEARVEIHMDNKEMIRLHMEIHEGKITLDFSGTSTSKDQLLTESATHGICLHAIADFYNFGPLINTGAFAMLQLTKPSGCLLNAKYPAPLSAGALSVKATLQTALNLALANIHTKKKKALSSFCPIELELKKNSGQIAVLRLPGGAGACSERASTIFALGETLSEEFSVEQLERNWPVRVQRMDYRNALVGKAVLNGGRGLTFKLEAIDEVQIQWRTDLTQHKVKVPKNSSFGDHAEVLLCHAGTESIALAPMGQMTLKAGDTLTLCSGTGGSWN